MRSVSEVLQSALQRMKLWPRAESLLSMRTSGALDEAAYKKAIDRLDAEEIGYVPVAEARRRLKGTVKELEMEAMKTRHRNNGRPTIKEAKLRLDAAKLAVTIAEIELTYAEYAARHRRARS